MGEIGLTASLATRVSKRTQVAFTHSVGLLKEATYEMAKLFYSVPEEEQINCIHEILQGVWVAWQRSFFQNPLSTYAEAFRD